MKVYNYNNQGYLIGISELDESDKCQITGEWLIPAQATEKEPLEAKEGYEVKFLENEWKYIKLLTDEELTSCKKDVRTAEEISYEASFPSQAELNNMEFEAKLLEKLIEWGVSINV